MQTISPQQLSEMMENGPIDVIDVRTPAEYREIHATCARNVPLESMKPEEVMAARNGSAHLPLYVICRSGSRSTMACRKLIDAGYDNIVNVDGGTAAWEKAGLPVVRGKKTMSLERQVRIAAGFLVLSGVLLSLVNPYFIILSGFVGAGLMFAGITDTCAMGMLIAKMPWNQVKSGDGTQAPSSCCQA